MSHVSTHAWALTTGKNIVSAHVLVEPQSDGEEIQRALQRLLKSRFGVFFSTIQIETETCGEEGEAEAIDFLRLEPETSSHHEGHAASE